MNLKKLVKKTSVYLPSLPVSVLLLLSGFLLILLGIFNVHRFLAYTSRIDSEAIIIEGWLPDYCFEKVVNHTKTTRYKQLFVTGGPIEQGSYLSEFKTYAQLGEATLKSLSVPDSALTAIPASYSQIDRTYASAIAFKKWIDSTHCAYTTFTLYSESTHTRRSLLLFKRALGSRFTIGSVAIVSKEYEPRFWWRSSNGVRSVIDESIAYLYALLFITFK